MLFDRIQLGVEPTIYGRTLLKRGLVAFDELKQSVRDIEVLADPGSGELRVGCPEPLAAAILPQIIECFSHQYPRVIVHVDNLPTPAILDTGLHERKRDLNLVRLALPPPENYLSDAIDVECLFDDPLVVLSGVDSRWARRRKIDLAELVDEPWILPPSNTWNYAGVAQAFQARGLEVPRAKLVTYSLHVVSYFVARGSFITAFPRTAIPGGALKVLPVEMPERPFPVAIVTIKNRTLSPVAERFIQCARDFVPSIGLLPRPCKTKPMSAEGLGVKTASHKNDGPQVRRGAPLR